MDMTKEKIQKIRKEYKANEDKNYHSENIVLLAKNFGTKEDFEKAKSLAKQAERAGYTPDDVNQEMNKIHKKLYPVLVSFERIYKMAQGGSVKKRYNRFGFKPYGETKGKFKLEYVENGEKQSEIIESEEMAVDTAKRYSKLGYEKIRLSDKDGKKIEFAKGGIIVTSISDIPDLEEKIKSGKVTYRGIGLGKMSKEFYEKTGEEGYRIKVDNKEYFITDSEFEKIARDKSGKMRIPFDAPRRKFDDGGELPSGQIKWQEADYGDSAYVKAEDKLGLIIKPYGRRFHLRFVDGTEKTYDAKELEFYKNGESYADGGEISEEDRFNYMMLDRLRSDVEYYLGYGRRRKNILRGGSVNEHINAMKEIWHKLPEKPQWLSMEEIDDYHKRMINEEEWEMIVISKKDDGEFIKNKYLVTAQNVDEAKKIAEESWKIENVFSNLSFVKVMTEAMYESKYKDQYAKGGEILSSIKKNGHTYHFTYQDNQAVGNYDGSLFYGDDDDAPLPSWATKEFYVEFYKDEVPLAFIRDIILKAREVGANILTINVTNGSNSHPSQYFKSYDLFKEIGFKDNNSKPDGKMYFDLRGSSWIVDDGFDKNNIQIKYRSGSGESYIVRVKDLHGNILYSSGYGSENLLDRDSLEDLESEYYHIINENDHYDSIRLGTFTVKDGKVQSSTYEDESYAKGGQISRKGTYTGRIIKTDDAGEVMIGKISGYHSSGEPVYDVHKFGELRKDMREKVGELSNTKIKNIMKTYAKGGMVSGRYYRDKDGNEFRYIGEGKDGKGLFQAGQNYVQKEYDEFGAAKETKLFGWFGDGGKVKRKRYETGGEILSSKIKFPFYFKSKTGIGGMDKDAIFQIKDIPDYGNIKVYYYDGILPRFFWMYKSEFEKKISERDFIISDKSKFKPNLKESGGMMAKGGSVDSYKHPKELIGTFFTNGGDTWLVKSYGHTIHSSSPFRTIEAIIVGKENESFYFTPSDFAGAFQNSSIGKKIEPLKNYKGEEFADGGMMAKEGQVDNVFSLLNKSNQKETVDKGYVKFEFLILPTRDYNKLVTSNLRPYVHNGKTKKIINEGYMLAYVKYVDGEASQGGFKRFDNIQDAQNAKIKMTGQNVPLMAKGGETKSTRLPEIAMELFKKPYVELTPQQQKVCRDERDKRMGFEKGGMMAKGGSIKKKRTRFVDKVDAIADRLEGTKVPKRLKKDYGGRYNREEAEEAGRRIAGAQLRDEVAEAKKKGKRKRF